MALIQSVALAMVIGVAVVLGLAAVQFVKCFIYPRWYRTVVLPHYCGFLASTLANGDRASLFVNARGRFRVFIRPANNPDASTWASSILPARRQSGRYNYWRGLAWTDPLDLPLETIRDGAYQVEIVPQDEEISAFIVPLLIRRKWAPIVVVASTNTWHAYNDFGGLSNYRSGAVPLPLRPLFLLAKALNWRVALTGRMAAPAVPLPFLRPLINIDKDMREDWAASTAHLSHLYRGELNLLRALDAIGVEYALATDEDVERAAVLDPCVRLVFFNTHSEYWTGPGIAIVTALIQRGVNVAFLSGNNMYRRVERFEWGLRVIDQRIEPNVAAGLLGAAYDPLGYLTFAGFRIVANDHWALANVNSLAPGGVFGRGDGSPSNPGGSGFETDKPTPSVADFNILAVGQNQSGPAYVVCRDLPNGAFIFNAASVAFTSLLRGDEAALQILRNIISRALPKQLPGVCSRRAHGLNVTPALESTSNVAEATQAF